MILLVPGLRLSEHGSDLVVVLLTLLLLLLLLLLLVGLVRAVAVAWSVLLDQGHVYNIS